MYVVFEMDSERRLCVRHDLRYSPRAVTIVSRNTFKKLQELADCPSKDDDRMFHHKKERRQIDMMVAEEGSPQNTEFQSKNMEDCTVGKGTLINFGTSVVTSQ